MTFLTEGPFLILESSNTPKRVFDSKELYDIMLLAITIEIWVVIAAGFHLFPFRTEKLSPLTPMVLQ